MSARAKWTTAALKVKKTANDLVQLLANATDRSPTETTLERKLKWCIDAFDKFEEAHATYLEVVDLVKDIEAAAENYNTIYDDFEKGVCPSEERLEAMKTPEVDNDVRVRQEIASLQRSADNQTALIDKMYNDIEKNLSDESLVHSKESLEAQLKFVDKADKMVEGGLTRVYKDLMVKDTAKTQVHEKNLQDKILAYQVISMKLVTDVTVKQGQLAVPVQSAGDVETPASHGGGRGRPESFFERRPFPKFDGNRRNYPGFKRECVSKSFREEFQLREIKRSVPKEIEPGQ